MRLLGVIKYMLAGWWICSILVLVLYWDLRIYTGWNPDQCFHTLSFSHKAPAMTETTYRNNVLGNCYKELLSPIANEKAHYNQQASPHSKTTLNFPPSIKSSSHLSVFLFYDCFFPLFLFHPMKAQTNGWNDTVSVM